MNELKLKSEAFGSIQKGSKSFFWAGLILGRETREDAFLLYSFCRYADDLIDGARDSKDRLEKLSVLREKTWQAVNLPREAEGPYAALAFVMQKYSIPPQYPMDLVIGMQMDQSQNRYQDQAELLIYCYHVAGVVGLMMAQILGVSHPKAFQHACDLGIAMQLTNICRDVKEDLNMGRIYLPQDLLRAQGVADSFDLGERTFAVVQELLRLADGYYRSGDQGLRYLNFRSRIAIAAARLIYWQIGQKILRRGPSALQFRSITSKLEKLYLLGVAGVWATARFAGQKWQRTPQSEVLLYAPKLD